MINSILIQILIFRFNFSSSQSLIKKVVKLGKSERNCKCLLEIAALRFKFNEIYCLVQKLMLNHENYAGDEVLKELIELKNVIASNLKRMKPSKNDSIISRNSKGEIDVELIFEQLKAEYERDGTFRPSSSINSSRRSDNKELTGHNLVTPTLPGHPSPLRRTILPSLNSTLNPEKTSPRFNVSTRSKPNKAKKSYSNSRKLVKGSNGQPSVYITEPSFFEPSNSE